MPGFASHPPAQQAAAPGAPALRRAERLRRIQYVAAGLLLQLLALAPVVAVLITLTRREDPLGEITKYSVRLGWHDLLHQPRWIAMVVACTLVYMAGAVVIAWPFTSRWWTRALAAPLAALASLALLGALALVCAAIVFLIAAIFSDGDVPDLGFGGGGGGGKGGRRPGEAAADPPAGGGQ